MLCLVISKVVLCHVNRGGLYSIYLMKRNCHLSMFVWNESKMFISIPWSIYSIAYVTWLLHIFCPLGCKKDNIWTTLERQKAFVLIVIGLQNWQCLVLGNYKQTLVAQLPIILATMVMFIVGVKGANMSWNSKVVYPFLNCIY